MKSLSAPIQATLIFAFLSLIIDQMRIKVVIRGKLRKLQFYSHIKPSTMMIPHLLFYLKSLCRRDKHLFELNQAL
jgi:hypothetical protein